MKTDIPLIKAGTQLNEVIETVSNTDNYYYCVVDSGNKLLGVITLNGIRNTFATQELNEWLVALDIMEPVIAETTSELSLQDALEKADKFEVGFLPVITSQDSRTIEGLLDINSVHRKLSAEILSKQKEADRMATAG
jgi:CIC family chloride channel protein